MESKTISNFKAINLSFDNFNGLADSNNGLSLLFSAPSNYLIGATVQYKNENENKNGIVVNSTIDTHEITDLWVRIK